MEQSEQKIKLTDVVIIRSYLSTQQSEYFDLLYARYSNKVYSKCIYLLKDEVVAQDATQDIFLKILLNLSKFKGKSKFSTWVYSITYNYCIDLIRKKKNKTYSCILSDEFKDLPDEEIPDSTILDRKVKELKIALEKIPIEDKAVLLMKYQSNLSIKEISEVINKSEDAVKMKIKRAKHKVQKVCENRTYSKRSFIKSSKKSLQLA